MKPLTRFSLLLAGVGLALGALTAAGAEDEKSAVAQALNEYYRAFSNMDVERAVSYYDAPVTFITVGSIVTAATRPEGEARLTALYKDLRPRGFARSELTGLSIKQLSAGLAVASGVAVRYKLDGNELNRIGVTYVLRKTTQGWKLAVLVSHDPGTALRLD